MAGIIERRGDEFLVGGEAAGEQYDVAVAASSGGFQIYWAESGVGGLDTSGSSIHGQLYGSDSTAAGSELVVNRTTAGDQSGPAVALLGDGKAAVAWIDASGTTDPGLGIKAQRISGGGLYYPEVAVNRAVTGDQTSPAVVAVGGGYVVAFADRNSGKVIAQAIDDYNASGTPLTPFVGNAIADAPSVAALDFTRFAYSAFVMVWRERAAAGSADGVIRGQVFSSYAAVGESFQVSIGAAGARSEPEVALLADGRLAVAWTGTDASGEGVKVRLFEADGTAITGEIDVNTLTAGRQHDAHLAALPGGGFGVVWTNEAGIGRDVKIQLFDNGGVRFGTETLVSASAQGDQYGAAITTLGDGRTLIAWTEQLAGADRNVKAQLFQLAAAPVPPGTPGDDQITGSTGADVISGLGGNDVIHGSAGDDMIDGGAGNDQLFGDAGDDRLVGGADDDLLQDVLVGNDVLDGGEGNDRIFVTRANNAHDQVSIVGGGGNDEIVFTGGGTDLTVDAGSGNDLIRFDLFDVAGTVTLGPGVDTIRFETVPSYFRAPTIRVTDFVGGAGGDVVDLGPALGAAPFTSGAAFLQQQGADVELVAARSDNNPVAVVLATFTSHVVADFTAANFAGAVLPATLEVSTAASVVNNAARLLGLPAVRITGQDAQFVNLAGGEVIKRDETAADPASAAIVASAAGATVRNEAGGFISATDGSRQAILGSDLAQHVENAGTIFGKVVLAGGADTYYERVGQSNSSSRFVDLGDGADIATFDLIDAPGLTNIDVAGGAGDDRVVVDHIGAGQRLRFNSFTGIETLELAGTGAGSTVELIRNGQTAADIRASGGLTVTLGNNVFSSAVLVGPATGTVHLNGATLSFGPTTAFEQIVGSGLADRVVLEPRIIPGNVMSTPNGPIDLAGGDDSFVWNAPHSSPVSVDGGAGSDLLSVGQFYETQTLAAFRGFETIEHVLANGFSGLTYTLRGIAADANRLLLGATAQPSTLLLDIGARSALTVGAGGYGLILAAGSTVARIADRSILDPAQPATDQRVENRGAVVGNVELGAGNDSFTNAVGGSVGGSVRGGAGDDLYVVDAPVAIVEVAGEGSDTVRSSISFSLAGQDIERLELSGIGAVNGTGNGLANTIVGNGAANRLSGGGGVDAIDGGGGDDVIDGGIGADMMQGGTGNDSYFVDASGDVVSEEAGAGTDTVFSLISYVLPAEVEYLQLYGTAAINGVGNALDNVIVGNDAANIIDGGAGIDAMAGGLGNDSYFVDSIYDGVVEKAGGGTDAVYATVGTVLTPNVEYLVLLGSADLTGVGNELDNTIVGNSGNNLLDGRAGNDAMAGGLGNDSYFVDSIYDGVVENPGGGTDIVYATVGTVLTPNVENLQLLGTADLTAVGNELANILIGNAGANILDGRAGNDVLVGLDGNDSYFVDSAGDMVVESAGGGTDTIYSAVGYTLPNEVETLQLTGAAGATATGNGLANILIGNAGANILDGRGGTDFLFGGEGSDVFVFRRGEANGDRILDFAGNGAGAGDRIQLAGYGAGSTFTQAGDDSTRWLIRDGVTGTVETIAIAAAVHPTDVTFLL